MMKNKEKIADIERRISELRRQRRQLEEEVAVEFQSTHRHNIGRCFVTQDNDYVVIIDVPQIDAGNEHIGFNQYQFPSFVIAGQSNWPDVNLLEFFEPFYCSTAFTRDGVSFGNDPVFNEPPWEEIEPDEFKRVFTGRVNQIMQIINKATEGKCQ